MRAHVIACTGYTWDQVGQLTIPRLKALSRYWQQHPPVHLMVAAYLGVKPSEPTAQTNEVLDAIVSTAPAVMGAPKLDTAGWANRSNKV